MQPDSPKLLEDIRVSVLFIQDKTRAKTLADYLADDLLRPAVERHFEIVGEALNRLSRRDPEVVARIDDHARIIAFRNILIHGYDAIDDRRVWDAVENSVPRLRQQVEELLREAAGP
jgi:uncharacterized protein with HEPN domain